MAQRGTRGKKGRSQDVMVTAEGKLQRHLRALGLESADAYRAWCRAHGFRDSLHKSWQEWREERRAVEKTAAAAAAEGQARDHLKALGLERVEQYQALCRQHGFGTSLQKTRQQRDQELRAAERARGQAAMAGAKRHTRRPQDTIQAIYEGKVSPDEIHAPYLVRIHDLFAAEPGPPVREALRRLLLHVGRDADLLDLQPALRAFRLEPGNTYLDALYALARHHGSWLRPLEEWRPDSHNRRRQFGSLARHLLAQYFVPTFMDAAWFRGDVPAAHRQQEWFKHIGTGQNIRTADVPVHLTKMMAHHFLLARADSTIEAALRWGQILGLGGDEPLVRAVVATRLGDTFEHEEFWATVLQWFVNHPMLDPACVGPIIDYVHHQKFVPQETVAEDGAAQLGDPPQPEFSMKGRSVPALLERTEAWHQQLARETRRPNRSWERSGIGEFRWVQEDKQSGNVICWSIQELLSTQELREEGKAMNHCVASYAQSCAQGRASIWSMRAEDTQQVTPRRVMTVEVKGRTINQARGKANAFPGSKGGSRLREGMAVLKQWAAAEGLTVGRHL